MKVKCGRDGLFILCSIPELKKLDKSAYDNLLNRMKDNPYFDVNDPSYVVRCKNKPFSSGLIVEVGYDSDDWYIA